MLADKWWKGRKEERRKDGFLKFYFKSLGVKCVSGFPGLHWSPEQAEYRKHTRAPGPRLELGARRCPAPTFALQLLEMIRVPASLRLLSRPDLWRGSLETHNKGDAIRWELALHLGDCVPGQWLVFAPPPSSHTRRPERIMNLHRSHMPVRLCCDVSDGSDWGASCNFWREPGHGECECAVGGGKSAMNQWRLMEAGGGRASSGTQITELLRTVIILTIKI